MSDQVVIGGSMFGGLMVNIQQPGQGVTVAVSVNMPPAPAPAVQSVTSTLLTLGVG